ncbi:signal recognition particle-docking protein FtsY [Litoreibacter arenae]|uniref:Signal recognition particle receptor FtsY n=1 Tax=Litoreibacter arenae DSM 19593 TaxID=1123360 RepID=S9QF68_9RHOB|nr:signal recognition particle-docking protein FtsY [Litoreibacter arenae]EPX80056.1 Signal recognition particle receptor protein FtsY [Litoreibacter arenae DSM 19593]
MSFFNKLKSKLFKSSSKLEEGLDAIVEDGGVEEELADVEETVATAPDVDPAPEPEPEPTREPTPASPSPVEVPEPRPVEVPKPEQVEVPPAPPTEVPAPDMSFFNKLKSKLFKSSSKLEEGLDAIVEDGGVEEELADVEETVATAPDVDPAPEPEPEPTREPTPASPSPVEVPEPRPVEVPKPEQVEVPPAPPTEVPAPDSDPEIQPEPPTELPQTLTPEAIPLQATAAPITTAVEAAVAAEPKKPGLFGRLLGRKEQKTVIRRELDDDMLEALEELLIASDMGVDTALRVTANMAEGRFGKKLSTQEIKDLLAAEIAKIMEPVAKPMPIYPKRPQVVLVVGVNGSGKTTTIGKLALQFSQAGKKVVIAAGDTFRAAAVEQLQVWGERAGVPVLTAPEGSDPASLAFDAMTKAEADGADLLMIDTAGRLQNRADLMEELAKIVRVIRKKDETAPHNTLLVLDATTGQNALNQVDVFRQISDVSGLVMTKLDGTAKGGVLVALADKFGLPIHAIGVGEQIDDLAPFDPEEFAQALTGAAAE